MSLKIVIESLEAQLNKDYEEYVKLHEALNTHRGKPLDDTNLPEVNRLIKEIQEKFAELYPVYSFIGTRYQQTVNVVNGYNEFIEQLKKAGAASKEAEKEDSKEV
jgi:hypothetical protein